MKKLTFLLGMSLMIICSSCETTGFALSGGLDVNTSKTENGKSKSHGFEFSGSPDVQEVQGKIGSKQTNEDGSKVKEKEVRGGVKRERKTDGTSGN